MSQKSLFLIAILLILPICLYTQTVEELATAKAAREKDVDDNFKSFSKSKFETAVEGCFSAYQLELNASSLSSGDKDTLAQNANKYYACTQELSSNADRSDDVEKITVTGSSTSNGSDVKQTGFCKYYDAIDGSDYLKVYNAAKQCYALEQTSGKVSGFAASDVDLFSDCGLITHEYDSNNAESVSNNEATGKFASCLDDALFYLLPYTERQFFNCEKACVASNADAPLKIENNKPVFTVTADTTLYEDCEKYSQACSRFDITVGGDQTNLNYADYYEACYETATTGCWFDTWDDVQGNTGNSWSDQTNINAYFTCVAACDRPNYKYINSESSTNLQPFLVALLVVVMSLV